MKKILLASSSPRRQEILKNLHIPFQIMSPDCDETYPKEITGTKIPVHLAEKKILAILEKKPGTQDCILAADTVVLLGGRKLGKPANRDEAFSFLKSMQGTSHVVATGIAFYDPESGTTESRCAQTEVFFKPLSDKEINWYLDTDEWEDAAGGYKIQGRGAFFVTKIMGNYSNVVGLPISELYDILLSHGFMSEAVPL